LTRAAAVEAERQVAHAANDWPRVAGLERELAACASGAERGARERPAPSPQLVSSAALDLPGDCQPEPGVVYRTTYTVQPDGHVSGVASAPGARCVQDALGRWVSTFRYRPGEVPVPQALDWMFVTASRGR
jgi:hypothetical protein